MLSNNYPRAKRSVDNHEDPLKIGTANETSQNRNDAISKITFVIYKVRKQINKLVANQVSTIRLSISEAEDSLKREYEELLKFTSDTQLEANEDGTDIQTCFNYTKYIDLNGIFSDCDVKEQPSFIDTENKTLNDVEEAFNEEVKSCQSQYNETAIDQCIQATVVRTKIKIFSIQKSTETLISMDNANHFNCIETLFITVDDGMNNAARNFNTCIEKIMDDNV